MKKKLLVSLLSAGTILSVTACSSNGDYAGSTNSASTKAQEEKKSEASTEKKETAKVEIVQKAEGTWKDSIGTVWVHSSAVFENKGDTPVKIGETQMNFKGKDGSILKTAKMVYSVPSVVAPGEKAFITESTVLEGVTDPAAYGETSFNFGFDKTDEDPKLLEISGVKGIAGDTFTPYKVTGVVKNTTNEKQDDVRIAAALFAEDGSLLGILKGSVDVGINPGDEAGFDLSFPELPEGVAPKVKNVEVKAYGWNW